MLRWRMTENHSWFFLEISWPFIQLRAFAAALKSLYNSHQEPIPSIRKGHLGLDYVSRPRIRPCVVLSRRNMSLWASRASFRHCHLKSHSPARLAGAGLRVVPKGWTQRHLFIVLNGKYWLGLGSAVGVKVSTWYYLPSCWGHWVLGSCSLVATASYNQSMAVSGPNRWMGKKEWPECCQMGMAVG